MLSHFHFVELSIIFEKRGLVIGLKVISSHVNHITATSDSRLTTHFVFYEAIHVSNSFITYCSIVSCHSFPRLPAGAENQSSCSQPLIIL